MDDFRIIYKILRILQNSMDLEEFDRNSISAEELGLHNRRRNMERYGLWISACSVEQTRIDLKGIRIYGRKQPDEKGGRPGKRNCRHCGKYDLIPPVDRPVVFLYSFLRKRGKTIWEMKSS